MLVLLLGLLPATARAQQVDEQAHMRGVRSELLIVDAAALAAGLTVALAQPFYTSDARGAFGRGTATTMAIGTVAAPTVYWANRHEGPGAASFALRAFLPLATGFFGMTGNCFAQEFENCVADGFVYGTAVGVVSAALIDHLAVSRIPQRPHANTRWYGWQTIVADAAGMGFGLYLYLNANERGVTEEGIVVFPLTQWLGIYFLGTLASPVIHLVHGEWQAALGALPLRLLGGPILGAGAMLGYCAAVAEKGCANEGFSWGMMVGAIFVAAIDATLLAREEVEEGDDQVVFGPTLVGDKPGLTIGVRF